MLTANDAVIVLDEIHHTRGEMGCGALHFEEVIAREGGVVNHTFSDGTRVPVPLTETFSVKSSLKDGDWTLDLDWSYLRPMAKELVDAIASKCGRKEWIVRPIYNYPAPPFGPVSFMV